MRPLRSFFLLLIFLVCFTGLHYLIHGSQFFPSLYEFVPERLVAGLSSYGATNTEPQAPINADSVINISSEIQLSVDSAVLLTEFTVDDYLMPFLDSLREGKGQIRVMYYGDSQIEGDRMTSLLRHTLRVGRRGNGPGLFLPLMPVMYTKSLWIRSSSNWERYTFLSYKGGSIQHRALGPFMAICRYLPNGIVSKEIQKATVRLKPSNGADSTVSVFDQLRVFYGNANGIVHINVSANGNSLLKDTLSRGKSFSEISCRLNGASEIEIEFSGYVSPDIYGISIESNEGIIVDNIPQRGSAGLEFTMVDKNNLKDSYDKLSPQLIILQFGLNIVKNIKDDYSSYRTGLTQQLKLIKEISPNSIILVVGLTDMAVKEEDTIRSYPNIPSIIEAQREASLQAGVGFWDAYNAMGGEKSIVKWAERQPALAQNDYTHLTYPGADSLSKLLIDELFSVDKGKIAFIDSIGPLNDSISLQKPLAVMEADTVVRQKGPGEEFFEALSGYHPDKPFIFTTAAFWIFFLIVLAGYSIVYKKPFIRNGYLFLVSIFFYYKSGGLFLFLLLFITIVDFVCGLLIYSSQRRFFSRLFLIVSIISNLGILAWFKYTAFITETINIAFGTHYQVYDYLAAWSNAYLATSFNVSNIILPVGISFFTFQSLSYIFDIYQGKMKPVRNIVDFGFYVSFFPQLVAGPIVRASEFIPQLYTKFHLTKREFSHSLFLISKGLIKKIIISDFIASAFIDRVFEAPAVYSGFENMMAVYGYGLQIYCDFSGYTDIAIGLGLILGFRFPVNFNSPYKAAGVSDFWKRWHISLSRWLKDYLYIPLGGNRHGKIRTSINLMITMLLGGLWHGASVRFILWGAMHGIGLIINRIWTSVFGERMKNGIVGRAVAVFITFQFVNFCWIFFRAPDMDSAGIMLTQIIENFSPGSYAAVIPAYSNVFLLIFIGYIIHFLPEKIKESYRGFFIKTPLVIQFAVVMLIAVFLFRMRSVDVMPFIYFRF